MASTTKDKAMTNGEHFGQIKRISGPVVEASNMKGAKLYEVARVGRDKLVGEIIKLEEDIATIQVYEQTEGVRPGEPVERTFLPLSVELGPGILTQIFDGIQRPLPVIEELTGSFISRGIDIPALDKEKEWKLKLTVKVGDEVQAGDVIATVQETPAIEHRILIPPDVKPGKVAWLIKPGEYNIEEIICRITTNDGAEEELKMYHRWPVRIPRPVKQKLPATIPLITGQRIFDTFFPIAKGGTAAIPGGFGTGKTVSQHQLAKWSDAKIVVYVGCGERGNEMTDVLEVFPELVDPYTGGPLMDRTTLIANTSNMPVAAREASVYTGVTIAEYFRDMGYDVSMMADSTSRWAEAMREISSRLEEMPGEAGYPAYLASKIAAYYERSGRVLTIGSDERQASISIVGAVSPPGGDFSEPVTQNTLRITKVFWALSKQFAEKRHFPAIDYLQSYTLYWGALESWFNKELGIRFGENRAKALALLQKDRELQEIVQLVGPDALPPVERVQLETAKLLREAFLQQNAFNEADSFCPPEKQEIMLRSIIEYGEKLQELLGNDADLDLLLQIPISSKLDRMKYLEQDTSVAEIEKILKEITELNAEDYILRVGSTN